MKKAQRLEILSKLKKLEERVSLGVFGTKNRAELLSTLYTLIEMVEDKVTYGKATSTWVEYAGSGNHELILNEEESRNFMETLENPPEATPALKQLLKEIAEENPDLVESFR